MSQRSSGRGGHGALFLSVEGAAADLMDLRHSGENSRGTADASGRGPTRRPSPRSDRRGSTSSGRRLYHNLDVALVGSQRRVLVGGDG
jgi:hypothetical protein